MDKDLGYQELTILAKQLENRAKYFSSEADESQAKGMSPYLASQRNSLEQARFTLVTQRNDFVAFAKERLAEVDKETTVRLLQVYGEFGVKER